MTNSPRRPSAAREKGRRRSRPEETRRLPLSHRRALVYRHTTLRRVDGLDDVRLWLADEVAQPWHATEAALGIDAAPIPYWAFAWAGGLALARYIQEHPHEVRDRRVLDLATGSGLVAITASLAGAASVVAADIDPFAEAAVRLNAKANGVNLSFIGRDLLDEAPPDVEVVLVGDAWYESGLAERVLPWLRSASLTAARVLIGDPGRAYLPGTGFTELARYEVRTTTELEDRPVLDAMVQMLD
jgi:predicted nicotinamide N-methyase